MLIADVVAASAAPVDVIPIMLVVTVGVDISIFAEILSDYFLVFGGHRRVGTRVGC
jgi:hypothetical protein